MESSSNQASKEYLSELWYGVGSKKDLCTNKITPHDSNDVEPEPKEQMYCHMIGGYRTKDSE